MEKSRTNIMIDGYNLGLEKGTGVATYARNLSEVCHKNGYNTELLYGLPLAVNKRSALLREVQFFGTRPQLGAIENAQKILNRIIPRPFGISATQVPVTGDVITRSFESRLPYFDSLWNANDLFEVAHTRFGLGGRFQKIVGLEHVDIMHWTYPVPIELRGAKNIYTLHDLVPLRLPYTTLDHKATYLKLMKKIVRRSDHIVTVSETSRSDIINLLDCPPEKVTNTYQSVEIPKKFTGKTDEAVKNEVEGAFGLPYKGYFLFFGAVEPKKNVGRVIEAYLTSELKEPLAIVGPTAWQAEQELRLYNEFKRQTIDSKESGGAAVKQKSIMRFEFVSFPLLVSIIRGAKATIFPSLYEGFGLPILESMLLGTPVITSSEGATAEIAGDAAMVVDPYDTAGMAKAMFELSNNDELRQSLIERGKLRAQHFSPEKYSERLKTLYERLR